jgi:2,3-bisphosphoglycerate-independent phosphoglycerate mutase
VGVGEADPRINPLVAARLPALRHLLGGRAMAHGEVEPGARYGDTRFTLLDATLGVEGLPQSGTGQTSLLVGVNAAARLGRHFGPWVPTGLRELLARENLLSRARRAGRVAAFANAYPRRYLDHPHGALRRPAAPPFAARAAGVLTRDEADLRARRAVASELDNVAWRERLDPGLPPISPAEAGAVLAGIAAGSELTLFAHYATDTAGHTGEMAAAVKALERVDAFLGGLVGALPDDLLLVVTSDHGNVEDVRRGHTTNPVPLIARGPGAERVAAARSIAGVVPELLRLLDID